MNGLITEVSLLCQYHYVEAHKGAVRGVAMDALNQVVISGGADCQLRFWHFKTKKLITSLSMDSQIARLQLHRDRSVGEAMFAVGRSRTSACHPK